MSKDTLSEIVRLTLEHTAAASSMKRASKSKSAVPVTSIILKHVEGEWTQTAMAISHSNAPDLILSNGIEEVEVEVKDYGSTLIFKAEISLARKSALADLFDLSLEKFRAGKDVLNRIRDYEDLEFDTHADLEMADIIKDKINQKLMSADKARSQVGRAMVDTKGKRSPRYISLMGGDAEDYKRVRHASSLTGSPRKLYTAATATIRALSSVEEGDPGVNGALARAICTDFTNDEYLVLFDGIETRTFMLKGHDPLGLGAPQLDGSAIKNWRFATHGGDTRPAVYVNIKAESGLVLI